MVRSLRADRAVARRLDDGLRLIREQAGIPVAFPDAVTRLAAERVAAGPRPVDRVDLTELDFVTLDPATSTDLDQAFVVGRDGGTVVVHYAIADVAAFVVPGDAIDAEAWRRAVTVYAPDGSTPLYPRVISSGAASLLPDGPRPAVVLEVGVAPDATPTLRRVRRALVRSRAKLAYETTTPDDLPEPVRELARRMQDGERRRGAFRIDTPEQEVVEDAAVPGGIRLRFAARQASEEVNASMSLAVNLAVASAMIGAGTGLFRMMADPTDREVASLRRTAASFGIDWAPDESLRDLVARIDATEPRAAALLMAARRAGGGASYAYLRTDGSGPAPWHAAMAAPYAHVTAPMRRLADRFVLELVSAQMNGEPVPDFVDEALPRLPQLMDDADGRAARIDRAAIDLAECLMLEPAIGRRFEAVVVETDPSGPATVHIDDPAVAVRVRLRGVEPGDVVELRLTGVDTARRRLDFTRTR
jgi:exoribonuclease R